jgi:predicted TPR repeat methyltransferase
MTDTTTFDQDYYDRFYRDPKTRVTSQETTQQLADFVCSYLKHIGQSVRNVLDMGCGLGLWREEVQRHFPNARYTGVEYSEYLCAEYGWKRGSVVDYRTRHPADLVVCQGVLQYLTDAECRAALTNLARLTRGALYVEALTTKDWEQNCDQSVTDRAVHLRSGAWYRRHLAKNFRNCGGGVFLADSSDASLFELERLD